MTTTPYPPTHIQQIYTPGHDYIDFSWTAPLVLPDYYQLSVRPSVGLPFTVQIVSTATTYRLQNLIVAFTYQFQISSIVLRAQSELSPLVQITIIGLPTPPTSPVISFYANIGKTATLSWEPFGFQVNSLLLYVVDINSMGFEPPIIIDVNSTQFVVQNLSYYNDYEYHLYYQYQYGTFIPVTISYTEKSKLNLSWRAPLVQTINNYTIQLYVNGLPTDSYTTTGSQTSYDLLLPNVFVDSSFAYTVVVNTSAGTSGFSPLSNSIKLPGHRPTQPTDFTASVTPDGLGILLSWTASVAQNSPVLSYIVSNRYGPIELFDSVVVSPTATHYTYLFSSMNPHEGILFNKTMFFFVVATSAYGNSNTSSVDFLFNDSNAPPFSPYFISVSSLKDFVVPPFNDVNILSPYPFPIKSGKTKKELCTTAILYYQYDSTVPYLGNASDFTLLYVYQYNTISHTFSLLKTLSQNKYIMGFPNPIYYTIYSVTDLEIGVLYKFEMTLTSGGNQQTSPLSQPIFLTLPPSFPDAPTVLDAYSELNSSTALVTWSAPENLYGSVLLEYKVAFASSLGNVVVTFPANVLQGNVTGLLFQASYKITIVAVSDVGNSPSSLPFFFELVTEPFKPGKVSITQKIELQTSKVYNMVETNTAVLRWRPSPFSSYEILSYVIKAYVNGEPQSSLLDTGSTLSSYTIYYLDYGVSYQFQVAARSEIGIGDFSPLSNAFVLDPYPPTIIDFGVKAKIVPGSTVVDVSWNEPNYTNGAPITSYILTIIDTITGVRQSYTVPVDG